MVVPGRCSVCGRVLDKPVAMLLGRGDRPTMVLCAECMHADPRSMLAIDDDADTDPIDVPHEPTRSRAPRWLAPVVAFFVALLSRCLPS